MEPHVQLWANEVTAEVPHHAESILASARDDLYEEVARLARD